MSSITTGPGERRRVDMTMMYAVHDAFQRDLDRLVAMASNGDAFGPDLRAGWDRFKRFLHVHHTAEDTHLWPVLRDRVAGEPARLAVLEQMDDEHTGLVALLDAVDEAVTTAAVPRELRERAERLAGALTAHCENEERLALPLVAKFVTEREWHAFGNEQRKQLGLGGAASFFPWLLDGADDDTRRTVLGYVPPPVRLLYRAVWRPRYLRGPRWQVHA